MDWFVLKLVLLSVVLFGSGKGSDELVTVQPMPLEDFIGPDALLLRLDKLLDVCIANYEDLTTDLLLGVAIANGQLKTILANPHLTNRPFIEALQEKCDYVESRIDSIFSFPSGANAIVSKILINSNFWQSDEEDSNKPSLESTMSIDDDIDTGRQSHGTHSLRSYLRVLESGAPSELQSDQCLSELLVKKSENELQPEMPSDIQQFTKTPLLVLSRGCSNAMSLRKRSYGYHLTHKFLFYLILGKQQFTNVQQTFVSDAKRKLCAQILRESQLIADLGYPEIFRDLFMEQVFFCAYVGDGQFRNKTWLSKIIDWQNESGCFKYYHDEDELALNSLTTECSTHMTGVGAAVLGLFAKLQLVSS